MKKQILFFMTAIIALLLLTLFAVWQNQSTNDNFIALPEDSCDALVLVEPDKQTNTSQYDLQQVKTKASVTEQYLPVASEKEPYLCYRKDLTAHINRTLELGDENICHYGLFEKNNKTFAVFYAEIQDQSAAEHLCHLLLCYRDYFPILLLGKFDTVATELLTDVCSLSYATFNNVSYFYQNLSVTSHETSGTLLLKVKETPRTLNLNQKMVAITFDDGPSQYTNEILQAITSHSAKATFFVNGSHVTEHPETIKNIFSNRCEIGNHTNLHELFNRNTQAIIRKTIEETNKKVRTIIGIGTFVVRPPGGEVLDRYQNPVTIGYPIVRWSLDTFDYTENQTAITVLESIRSTEVKHGEIILMHDTKKVTAEAAESIVSYLLSQNFQLVTVSELLEFTANGVVKDRIYNNTYSAN